MNSKCRIKGKYAASLCDSMRKKYKGVESATIVQKSLGIIEPLGDVVWLTSEGKKISINFCPFCGEKIFDCDHPQVAE